ncbi:MAG: hypothetical protein EOP55_24070 [Sphingobacteriales bacterium]|nr:MAG: hypothetical protein EOP55_24070 [Sphingobacteriales bacterium]
MTYGPQLGNVSLDFWLPFHQGKGKSHSVAANRGEKELWVKRMFYPLFAAGARFFFLDKKEPKKSRKNDASAHKPTPGSPFFLANALWKVAISTDIAIT